MKKLFSFLILFFLIFSALAEEVTIEKDKTYTYKIYAIDLVGIGTSGSVHIKVNQVDKLVSYNTPTEVFGLIISLIDSNIDAGTAKLSINQTAECLVDADCNKNEPCTRSHCELRKCKFKHKEGCALNNECKPKGSLGLISNVLSYCDGSLWNSRKQIKESCKENYECITNYCSNNYCKSLGYLRGGEKMAPAWILIIFGVYFGIKGAFALISPKYMRIIGSNLLKLFSNKWIRVIGAIDIAIATALIVWVLI